MNEINKIRRCYNCGAILQSSDKEKEGYVDEEILNNSSQNFLFCNSCFEKEKYQPRLNEPKLDKDYLTLLNDAKEKDALIVYVINIFSFEASFIHQINEIIDGMNILVIANKFDLMPASLNKDDAKAYVAHRFHAVGLKQINPDDVILANAFDDETAKEIVQTIYERKNGKDVFILGSSLSGKTTLLHSILRVYQNMVQENIVTEPYINTSLEVTKIPLTKKTAVYSTPGTSIDNSILFNLDKKTFNDIYVFKPLKGKNISLGNKQAFFIGGFAIIEVISSFDKKTDFTCYFHEDIPLKKVSKGNKNFDDMFIYYVNQKKIKPALSTLTSIKMLDTYEIEIPENKYRDIGILGLGWLTIHANNTKLRIYVPKNVSIYTSRPKVLN